MNNGANIHEKDNDGCTALYIAAQEGNAETVELLIKHKADVDVTQKDGSTALNIGIYNGMFINYK